MIKNNSGESFVGIVIGIVLLSLVILGMTNLISYSNAVNSEFEKNSIISLLKDNSYNLVQKINTSGLNIGEDFYIMKDNNLKMFKVMTGITNTNYKYIDKFGENVSKKYYEGYVFERIFKLEKIDSITGSKIFNISIKLKN